MDGRVVQGGNLPSIFEHDGIRIDFSTGAVSRGDTQTELSATELRLLTALFESRGWVIGHDELVRRVWGPAPPSFRRNLKLYIFYLRRKIEVDASKPSLILTRRKLGYMFSNTGSRSFDVLDSPL